MAHTVSHEAAGRFRAARQHEPHPLYARRDEVVRYVQMIQAADTALARAAGIAGAGRSVAPHARHTLPPGELRMLRRRRASADAAVARQVLLAARRLPADHAESIETLNAIFMLGHAPEPPLDGVYSGQFVASVLFAPLDAFGRFAARLWMPWKGKRFDARAGCGDNIFESGVRIMGRLWWPAFSDYRPYRRGLVTAFKFTTYVGPGIRCPEVSSLKLDYDRPDNPRFLVRRVLDEVVQITGNYYLGRAFLRRPSGGYRLTAFFALQEEQTEVEVLQCR